ILEQSLAEVTAAGEEAGQASARILEEARQQFDQEHQSLAGTLQEARDRLAALEQSLSEATAAGEEARHASARTPEEARGQFEQERQAAARALEEARAQVEQERQAVARALEAARGQWDADWAELEAGWQRKEQESARAAQEQLQSELTRQGAQ